MLCLKISYIYPKHCLSGQDFRSWCKKEESDHHSPRNRRKSQSKIYLFQ